MTDSDILNWLLDGDVSIQYQVRRDLLGKEVPELRSQIANEGWGKEFLSRRHSNGHWGRKFYQPKWISSHYTLLDLRTLCIDPNTPECRETCIKIANEEKAADGGVNPAETIAQSDVCVNGMFMNYASYFKWREEKLKSVVDFILTQRLPDGGFNCMFNRSGAVHSSMHSTISILEGIIEYKKNGYQYRLNELLDAKATSEEFLLMHRLFRSDHSGEIIKKEFLNLSFPGRWKYNILRAMDYFQYANTPWDDRMQDALAVLYSKQKNDGRWNLQAKHPGVVHFEMEKAGKPSRWNTLRALRVLRKYSQIEA